MKESPEILKILHEEQTKFFERVEDLLIYKFDKEVLIHYELVHFINIIAEIISLSDDDTDLEYCKKVLETLVKKHRKLSSEKKCHQIE